MKRFATASLVGVAMTLGACAGPIGSAPESGVYGEATDVNFAAQDAYNLSNARLRDLGRDFAANAQDTVTFAFDRSDLDATARKALDGQAKWLKEHPGVKMTIIGHTDLVGSEGYNNGLGLRRARSALRYLVRKGVARGRLAAIESKGESEPVVQTEDRERRNRRAVTTVTGLERNYVGTGLDGELAARIYNQYQRLGSRDSN